MPLFLKIFRKNLAIRFYKREINHLQTLLLLFVLLFIELCIQKRHFSSIESEIPTTKDSKLTRVLKKKPFRVNTDICRPSFSRYPNSNQTIAKQRDFFKKLTFQELDVLKLQIFS